ncbi:LITAF-like zinc ribbon domain-containing protein [Xylariaceae sp. FL0016]|nr:LITAF-like zinc ribbon domain-containing protein [Xylariaceae sp. FL0016]
MADQAPGDRKVNPYVDDASTTTTTTNNNSNNKNAGNTTSDASINSPHHAGASTFAPSPMSTPALTAVSPVPGTPTTPVPAIREPEPAHPAAQPPPPSYQESQAPKGPKPNQPPPSHAGGLVRPVALASLGSEPAVIECPWCAQQVQTRIEQNDSSMTMLAGVGLCLLCVCCACIPCMAKWCQDVDHFCTNCRHKVAHVPYSGVCQPIVPAQQQQQQQQPGQGPKPNEYEMGNPRPYGGQPPTPGNPNANAGQQQAPAQYA